MSKFFSFYTSFLLLCCLSITSRNSEILEYFLHVWLCGGLPQPRVWSPFYRENVKLSLTIVASKRRTSIGIANVDTNKRFVWNFLEKILLELFWSLVKVTKTFDTTYDEVKYNWPYTGKVVMKNDYMD
jgi:hypothetical protein